MYGSTERVDQVDLEETLIDNDGSSDGTTRNALGVFNGVLVPCLLNIMGIILFLRIGWAVSHAGWLQVVFMLILGESVALCTVFSMSAVVSNGNIRGGGSYFLLSRSLGPELGGSIGLLFYISYALGTSFYVIGFAEEVVAAFTNVEEEAPSRKRSYVVIAASSALAIVMAISYLGAAFFTRINIFVFMIQFGAIVLGILSIYFRDPIYDLENGGTFEGANIKTLRNNMYSDYTLDGKCGGEICDFKKVLAIIFPMFTGIMEGANLSGDLKNPNRDISRGTIGAVLTAITVYLFLIFAFSAGFERGTLKTNMNVMENVAWPSKYVIILGIAISSFSSALGSVFGGSRVLQALGRDDLPPGFGLQFFAKGSVKGDEPRRAVIFTWFVAQCACLIGNLDIVSPIIASFFLLSYACVNLTCFMLDVSGTPNFRPHFQWFSRSQSFFGFSLCLGILFYLNVWYAVIALMFLVVLFLYILASAPAKSWGDVSQSILYHQVRKYLLKLDLEDHPKNWRPSLLLLTSGEHISHGLLQLSNSVKKGGLFVVGNVCKGDLDVAKLTERRNHLAAIIKDLKLKCIPEVTCAPSQRAGYQQLILLGGLGGMKPNVVEISLPEKEDAELNAKTFASVLRDILVSFSRNALVTCNFKDANWNEAKTKLWIDIWIIGNDITLDGTLSLKLQLAHILRLERGGKSKIRLLNVVDELRDVEEQQVLLDEMASRARLHHSTSRVIASSSVRGAVSPPMLVDRGNEYLSNLNHLLATNSQFNTRVLMLDLPTLPKEGEENQWLDSVRTLVANLPPTLLVRSPRRGNMIPEEL